MKYLSDEWVAAVTSRFQTDPGVLEAAKGRNVAIRQIISGVPEVGEAQFVLRVREGVPEVQAGDTDKPDATIRLDYDTAVAIDKGEITPQGAFMGGRLKIQGNLMRMMQLTGFLNSLGDALKGLDRDY